jgi:hypothetical protein
MYAGEKEQRIPGVAKRAIGPPVHNGPVNRVSAPARGRRFLDYLCVGGDARLDPQHCSMQHNSSIGK